MYFILAIIIMSAIIMIHEFGHFLAAKYFRVGIIEYSIGMGSLLFAYRKKDTVWSLRALPIGGFCAMYGENSVEAKDKDAEKIDGKKQKTPLLNKLLDVKVPEFKTDWRDDQAYDRKSKIAQIIILFAGPLSNILTGILCACIYVAVCGAQTLPVIEGLVPETPVAKEAGVEIGDVITGVNGRKVLTFSDYDGYVSLHPKEIENGFNVTFVRNYGKADEFEYTLRLVPVDGRIGIIVSAATERKSLIEFPKYVLNQVGYWIRLTLDSIRMLFTGQVSINDMSGVLGTTAVMNKTMQEADDIGGKSEVMRIILVLVMFVSINLGIMNLIPIPALDGGRILITWIEGAFEKTIPAKVQYGLNFASFGFLLCLMGYTLIADFVKIVMGWI